MLRKMNSYKMDVDMASPEERDSGQHIEIRQERCPAHDAFEYIVTVIDKNGSEWGEAFRISMMEMVNMQPYLLKYRLEQAIQRIEKLSGITIPRDGILQSFTK